MNYSLSILGVSFASPSAAVVATEFALNWLVQSSLLISAGLFLANWFRSKGSATQSLIYRTTLTAVLICPLATITLGQLGVTGWSIQLPDVAAVSLAENVVLDSDVHSPSSLSTPSENLPSVANDVPNTFPNQFDEYPDARFSNPSDFDESQPAFSIEPSSEAASMDAAVDPTIAPSPTDPVPPSSLAWLGPVALLIAAGWILTTVVLLTRLIASWWRLSRLVRAAHPTDAPTHQLCQELAAAIGVATPNVLHSPFLSSPCLAGLGLTRSAAILLPEDQLHLPVRDVLVHELAHLRRHDVRWNLLRQVATAVYFFQPLLWILSRRIEFTAEEVCDDFVVQTGGDREDYANQLVDIAELSADVSAAAVAAAGVGIVSLRSMLARRVERIMDSSRELSTRVSSLLMLAILLIGLAGTAAVGLVGLNVRTLADEAAESTEGDREGEAPSEPLVAQRETAAVANDTKNADKTPPETPTLEYTGQVLDPDGQPVAGANIYLHIHTPSSTGLIEPNWKPVTATGADGKYRFEYAANKSLGLDDLAKWGRVVATKEGFGFGVAGNSDLRKHGRSIKKVTDSTSFFESIRLTKNHPIQGRIIDVDGEPVVGARLMLIKVYGTASNDLAPWKKAAEKPNADFYSGLDAMSFLMYGPQVPSLVVPAKTDADGKFKMDGIGAGHIGVLSLSGPGIETATIYVRSEPGESINLLKGPRDTERDTYYASTFEYVSAPSVPVTGVVRASDTGDPISGVTVKTQIVNGVTDGSIRSITDADGRYRLEGLPLGEKNYIAAIGLRLELAADAKDRAESPAYLSTMARASTDDAMEEIEIDMQLERGSWLHGRISNQETNKGLPGYLTYYTDSWKPSDRLQVHELDRLQSDQDGRFCIAVPERKGYIAFMAKDTPAYPFATGIEGVDGKVRPATVGTEEALLDRHYHIVAEYEADENECERDLKISKGLSRTGTVIGPDKQPVKGFHYLSRIDGIFRHWDQSTSDEFTLDGYVPNNRRDVYFVHTEKNLTGHIVVSGADDEPLVVQLVKGGTVTGRLVDEDGEPLSNRRLERPGVPMAPDENMENTARSPSLPYNANDERGGNKTDDGGRFTLACLLPDTEYRVDVQSRPYTKLLPGTIKVAAGESKDLGDICITGDGNDCAPPKPAE